MASTTTIPSATPQSVTYGRDASIARFSVASYQKMIEAGILTADDKVELLENYVVYKFPPDLSHDGPFQGGPMTPTTMIPPPIPQPVTYGHDAAIAQFSVAGYQKMIETVILHCRTTRSGVARKTMWF